MKQRAQYNGPKYVTFQVVANSSWWGRFSTETIVNIECRKIPTASGLLDDTLQFPRSLFFDVDKNGWFNSKPKTEFLSTEIERNSGNCGSFNQYVANKPGMIKMLSDFFEKNGWNVILLDDDIKIESEKSKKYTDLLAGLSR